MTEVSDLVRVLAALGLLAVGGMIYAAMRPRLYDKASVWLAAYVFGLTLLAFVGSASRIGSDEPLVWYGSPGRLVVVVTGLIYIWNARRKETVDNKQTESSETLREQEKDDNLFDRLLKRLMPNGTVMRRYIALGIISGVVFVTLGLHLIERTDNNALTGQRAICAVLSYGEDAVASAKSTTNVAAVQRLERMNSEMRATGVDCPPPRTTP